ncbi:MAG TPA: hypothetical protein VFW29_05550 [Solirubrobacteraceae bacterium]|nr:hypothetical protein [Solirubrobacteraceae bacterium]
MGKRGLHGCIATLTAVVLMGALALGGAPARADAVKAMWGPYRHNGVSQFPVYKELGISIYEDDLHWDEIAPTRPRDARNPRDAAYHWPEEVDDAVAEANANGIRVALQIIGAPRWANGRHPSNWAPNRVHDYSNFAIAAARRYPAVHLWMVWGEPVRSKDFEPLTPAGPYLRLNARQRRAPHRYARMLDATWLALHHESGANVVIGGMTDTAADITTRQWIENLRMPDGRAPRLDLYGHNPFSVRAPNLANRPAPGQQFDFSDLRRLSAVVARFLGTPANPAPRLFLSEWTVPTSVDKEFDFYVSPLVQAQWITAGLKVAAELPQVYAVGWIHLYDNPPASMGGLIAANGARKPGFAAFSGG